MNYRQILVVSRFLFPQKQVKELNNFCVQFKYIPPPSNNLNKPLRALIFDSVYGEYKGVIVCVRIVDGKIEKGDQIEFMSAKNKQRL